MFEWRLFLIAITLLELSIFPSYVLAQARGIKLSVKTTFVGGFISLYLQGKQGKIVGEPDWVLVLLPERRRAVYSLSSKKYLIGTKEGIGAWDRQSQSKVRWGPWKMLGPGTAMKGIHVTKWERTGTGLWKNAVPGGVRQEVWATEDFPIDPYLLKSFCGICKVEPPKGIPVKLLRTASALDGSREVEMDLNLVEVQDVSLKQSDFELPKGLKRADDFWSVVSGGGVHDSLFRDPTLR